MKHAEHGDPTHQSGCGTIAIAQIPGTPQVASQTISRSWAPPIGEHTSDILAERNRVQLGGVRACLRIG